MAGHDGIERIPPSSPVYQEVARLYRIARQLRAGGPDRWNGDLYARHDDKWGGLRRDGTLRLNQDRVLRHLTGGRLDEDPAAQSQALATVLHEAYHAGAGVDAEAEPNAIRRQESRGLDEGLTEMATIQRFQLFARRAGYDGVPDPRPEYRGAFDATNMLLDHISTSEVDRTALLDAALDQPLVMRWDTMADHVVRNHLPVVPADPQDQQAARAHLVNRMALFEWSTIHDRPEAGPVVAAATLVALERAKEELRQHYRENPDVPYPARNPNPAVDLQADVSKEQARGITPRSERTDLSALPPELRVLSGQAPAAGATRRAPVLGDGGRGAGQQAMSPTRSRTPRPAGRDVRPNKARD